MRKYADRIPAEIKRAIAGIDGEKQYAIVVLLIKEDRLSFTEIKEELDLHQQQLSNSLDKLQDGSLVIRREVGNMDDRYQAIYQVTKYGKRFLDKLYATLESDSGMKNEHMGTLQNLPQGNVGGSVPQVSNSQASHQENWQDYLQEGLS